MTNSTGDFPSGQFSVMAIANFVPTESDPESVPSSSNSSAPLPVKQLAIFVGDKLRVIAHRSEWCYGYKVGDPTQCGLFPRAFVRPFRKRGKNGITKIGETELLLDEVTEAIKAWWKCTKALYGAENTPPGACDGHICRIRQLMALRRRLRSGTVPTEELRELRLNVAKLIDLGNAALHLPMHIRDQAGRVVPIEDLSIINAYKRHEEAHARIIAQQQEAASNTIKTDDGTVYVDTVAKREWCQQQMPMVPEEYAILVSVEQPRRELPSGNVEIVLGLGQRSPGGGTTKSMTNRGPTRPISEPLTIYLNNGKERDAGKAMTNFRALFVGLTDSEVRDEHGGLTLWATILRIAPLITSGVISGTLGKTTTGEEVRQFYAHGQADLGELCSDMEEKEQRELNIGLLKKSDPLPAICQLPSGSSASVPYVAQSAEREKIPLNLTIQLFRATRLATSPEVKNVQILRKLKDNGDEGRRNEVFIWLRSADLHGVGRAEKNVEANISVVDDEGVFQPEAIEIVTPEGPRRQSSFRCRVWFSEDRPKLNELIKVRLPEAEVPNLHLQILFYNKSTNMEKKLAFPSSGSSSSKAPFALAFLRLINNFVLCGDDEDELFIYKPEKSSKNGGISAADGTRPISVAYLAQWAKRKEMRAAGRASASTLTRAEAAQLGTAALYTLQSDKNGVQFVSFVSSSVHTTCPTLLQILRWRDNELQLGQRLHELSVAADLNHDYGEELRKFLPNILDALFQIAETVPYLQRSVFDVLVHICRICDDTIPNTARRLKPALEQYIQTMHFPNAHGFILKKIIWYVENESERSDPLSSGPGDQVLPVLKSLHPLIQLAISSKQCADIIGKAGLPNIQEKNKLPDGNVEEKFRKLTNQLMATLAQLLENPGRRMTSQNVALKHLAFVVGPLATHRIYELTHLAKYVLKVLDSLAEGVLMRQRLHFIGEIIGTELFSSPECRQMLMTRFLDELVALMPPHLRDEEERMVQTPGPRKRRDSVTAAMDSSNTASTLEAIQLSARILADLLERLFPPNSSKSAAKNGTPEALNLLLRKCVRPLNQTMVTLLGDPTYQRPLHTLLLALLDKFSAQHFNTFFRSLRNQLERLDTLSEMLHLFRDLLSRNPVPVEWRLLRRAQLRLIARHLRFAAALIRRDFGAPTSFETNIWHECMLSCMALAKYANRPKEEEEDKNELLKEETEQEDVRDEIDEAVKNGLNGGQNEAQENGNGLSEYSAEILRSLWFCLLSESKIQLMPDIIGPVLELAFASNRLRQLAIPIFVDMLATEQLLNAGNGTVVLRRRVRNYDLPGSVSCAQLSHARFADLFIRHLDALLDFALGDVPFREFRNSFSPLFLQYYQYQSGTGADSLAFRSFVQRVDRLLELFSAYRSVQEGAGDEMAELGMFCTAQLVDFYQSIEQHSLYVLYLYKLYTLHNMAGNWVEAALTLKRHADLLRWTPDRPASWLCGSRKQNAEFSTQMELKEHIYREMAELFTRGEHWELAIETNRELANIQETAIYDYTKLAGLLSRNAALYEKITKTIRVESHYFLVAFYGKDCPAHLSKRKFVFRGHPLEQWGCFKQRLAANFADFQFLDTLNDGEETHGDADGKFLQVVPVTPLPQKDTYAQLLQSPSRLTSWYYKHHRVQRFEFVRREFRHDTKWTRLEDNEATRLWLLKRVVQIQRPLPDLLSFGPVVQELELDPMNPVEVASDKMREANDKLAETAALVAEGFSQQLVNLAGMIRGVVQADVGGGIRNYQAFFSEESRAQCTEEERHSIATLKRLILEQTALLEYALFIHAQSDQAQANPMFHNSLAGSFMEHRQRVEHRFGQVKSLLPEKASICVLEPPPNGAMNNKTAQSIRDRRQTAQSSTSSMAPKLSRMASMGEASHQLLPSSSHTSNSQAIRPISTGSNSGGSATTTSSSCSFKNSPLNAAHSLIKTTIQGKSKSQKLRARSKSTVAIADDVPIALSSSTLSAGGHEPLLSTICASQIRMSDTSMETFLMMEPECAEPPLPARLSNAHSKEMRPHRRGETSRK